MTTEIKTTRAHIDTASIQTQGYMIRSSATKMGRFSLHFREILLAMMIGMPIFFSLHNLIYVRGEITREEYDQMRRDLES